MGPDCRTLFYAPYFWSLSAWASMSGMAEIERNRPSMPLAQARSVNAATSSTPAVGETSRKGFGCQEWPLRQDGVEWSEVTTSTSGLRARSRGRYGSSASIAPTLASNLPSSPAESVFL